jgi:hypothetical protein
MPQAVVRFHRLAAEPFRIAALLLIITDRGAKELAPVWVFGAIHGIRTVFVAMTL